MFVRETMCGEIIVWRELADLHIQWQGIPSVDDGFFSGVLADYIEDHFEELVAVGNKAERIKRWIGRLRERWGSEYHNGKWV